MAAIFNKFDLYSQHLLTGVHDLTTAATGKLMIALCPVANEPNKANVVLGELVTISPYTNLITNWGDVTGATADREIGDPTIGQPDTAGVTKVILPDMTITASGGAIAEFQWVVLYNDTPVSPAKPLIGWMDYGTGLTLADGESLVIDFSDTLGLFTLT